MSLKDLTNIYENMNHPTLWLIRGIPGSGKSTIAKQIVASHPNTSHCEADMFFVNEKGDYVYNPSLIKYAHQWCQEETEKDLKSGKNVVVSNTFTTFKEMKPYEEMAARLGVKIEIIVARGNYQNVHNVPSEVLDKMRSRWQE